MRPLQRYMLASQRRRSSQRRAQDSRLPPGSVGIGCGLFLAVLVVAAVLAGAVLYASLLVGLPAPDRLPVLLAPGRGTLLEPTRLYDRDGANVLYTLENSGVQRRYVPLDPQKPDHIAPLLVQVIVSSADPTFWKHSGSTWASLTASTPVTLTERLVDRLLLDQEAPGWRRSLRTRLLAMQATARFGRAQVLEWYLNSAYFGHLAYGADSAAQAFFGHPASSLTLAEVATLVAAQEAPALNPLDAPRAALERQQVVLDRLLEKNIINSHDYLQARANPPALRQPRASAPLPAEAFARLVTVHLEERIGKERLERGGLRVLTTLDYDLQMELDCAARAELLRAQGKPGTPDRADGKPCAAVELLPAQSPTGQALPPDMLASAAVLDVQTGEVLAYVNAVNAAGSAVTVPPYQPGSLLTPFVALAGFARGMGPASLMWDIPASLPAALRAQVEPVSTFHGPVRLRIALANDYLAPFAQLLDQIGPANVWQLAVPLGLRGLENAQKPGELIYAGGDTTLLDVAQAYATLANDGVQAGESSGGQIRPALVRSVKAEGQTMLSSPQESSVAVLSAPLAYLLHDILSDDSARSDASGYAALLAQDRPSAAKTGSADGGRQAWTVGYTPQRLVVTWLGLPDGSPGKVDARNAAGLWSALLQTASRGLPALGWNEPAGISHVQVCDPSGLLPTAACPEVVGELFLNGNEPLEADTLYRSVEINRETGRLATVFTPPALVEEKTFLVPPPDAQEWARAAGLPTPPESYDAIQPQPPLPDVNLTSPLLFGYVRGKVVLRGTAAGTGFGSYRLQVGQGLNPRTWLQVGQESQTPVQDGTLAVWDTAGLDGLYAVRLQVVRQDNRLDTATIQVTVDNIPPQVRVLYPDDGQQLSASEQVVTLLADISDNTAVARVEWWLDGQQIGQRQAAPFSLPWQPTVGTHTLIVKAYDQAGNENETRPVAFTVK